MKCKTCRLLGSDSWSNATMHAAAAATSRTLRARPHIDGAHPSRAAPHAHKPRTPPTALRLEPRRAALDGRAAAPLRVAAEFPPTQTRFLHGRGTWVLALRCRYLAQSLSCGIQIHVLQHWLHTTLVVATISYSCGSLFFYSSLVPFFMVRCPLAKRKRFQARRPPRSIRAMRRLMFTMRSQR